MKLREDDHPPTSCVSNHHQHPHHLSLRGYHPAFVLGFCVLMVMCSAIGSATGQTTDDAISSSSPLTSPSHSPGSNKKATPQGTVRVRLIDGASGKGGTPRAPHLPPGSPPSATFIRGGATYKDQKPDRRTPLPVGFMLLSNGKMVRLPQLTRSGVGNGEFPTQIDLPMMADEPAFASSRLPKTEPAFASSRLPKTEPAFASLPKMEQELASSRLPKMEQELASSRLPKTEAELASSRLPKTEPGLASAQTFTVYLDDDAPRSDSSATSPDTSSVELPRVPEGMPRAPEDVVSHNDVLDYLIFGDENRERSEVKIPPILLAKPHGTGPVYKNFLTRAAYQVRSDEEGEEQYDEVSGLVRLPERREEALPLLLRRPDYGEEVGDIELIPNVPFRIFYYDDYESATSAAATCTLFTAPSTLFVITLLLRALLQL